MLLFLLAYLGGVLTIVSPCILPVLPFVFARADRAFLRNGLPLLLGMAVTFALVATLAAVAGGWAVAVNQSGRIVALTLLALFGMTLLFPAMADRLARPLVALGARLSESAAPPSRPGASAVLPSALLGVATGLLWAPCAGPILGLILTTAALRGASPETSLLLFSYALGAATSLALALLVGRRAFAAMTRSLRAAGWIRRGLGAAVLAAVAVIALHLDTGFLTRVALTSTSPLERGLLRGLGPVSLRSPSRAGSPAAAGGVVAAAISNQQGGAAGARIPDPFDDLDLSLPKPQGAAQNQPLPVEGRLPSLSGAVAWLNSPPLTAQQLRGKVVLIDFWTYSCINCLRTVPYLRAWERKYGDHGLVIIGVHTPEFAFEKNVDNVMKAVTALGIRFPVAIDSNYVLWRAFNNDAWPADYFIDSQGLIRAVHIGEGQYATAEHLIQRLLTAAGQTIVPEGLVDVSAAGAEAAPDLDDVESEETYIGYDRATNFISPGGQVRDVPHLYRLAAGMPGFDQWALAGRWTVGSQRALLDAEGGSIVFRFHARDLHLVLGPGPHGAPVRFRVTLDGAPPGVSHGSDINAAGVGVITGQRLYQLIRQHPPIKDHTFEIRFLNAGAQAYSFTFG
jgi:cytochrome c biogenesis protein CcdA/thiol-disulfide isomerase/thioredoxin